MFARKNQKTGKASQLRGVNYDSGGQSRPLSIQSPDSKKEQPRMPRIQPMNTETAQGEAATILADVKQKMGMVPNIVATMANSPAVAKAYLAFSGALGEGLLPGSLRERIALTVGQANSCDYCVSAHAALGKMAGLTAEEITQARLGTAPSEKEAAALEFARQLVDQRGLATDTDIDTVRAAGYNDGEIAELVANVALNLFTNYFNHVTDPQIDFPVAPALQTA